MPRPAPPWAPGLDLLLQVVLHPHAQLVELVPLLGQAHGAVPVYLCCPGSALPPWPPRSSIFLS